MGARVYLPSLGRFLQVDPIEGGVDNSYVYPPDGVNELDLDGNVAVLAVAAGALYVGGIAWAGYDFYKNPTPANAVWLGIAVLPGIGVARYGAKAPVLLKIGAKSITVSKKAVTKASKALAVAKSIRVPAINKGGIYFKATYTASTGQKRFIKLDEPDKVRPYIHWVKGRVNGKGNEMDVNHYRWWGREVH